MPRSSSFTVTGSVAVTEAYSPPAAVWVSVTASSAPSSSSAAVTVTVWAVFQLPVVKVREALSTDTSVSVCPETATVTVSEGCVASLTV